MTLSQRKLFGDIGSMLGALERSYQPGPRNPSLERITGSGAAALGETLARPNPLGDNPALHIADLRGKESVHQLCLLPRIHIGVALG